MDYRANNPDTSKEKKDAPKEKPATSSKGQKSTWRKKKGKAKENPSKEKTDIGKPKVGAPPNGCFLCGGPHRIR